MKYSIKYRLLERVEGDFLVTFCDNFSFERILNTSHIMLIRKLSFVLHNSIQFPCDTFILIFNSLVRSQREYSTLLWVQVPVYMATSTRLHCYILIWLKKWRRIFSDVFFRSSFKISYNSQRNKFKIDDLAKRRFKYSVIFIFTYDH